MAGAKWEVLAARCGRYLERNGMPGAGEIRKQCRTWIKRTLMAGRDMLVKAMLAGGVTFVILHFLRALWTVYIHTPVGQVFTSEVAPNLTRHIDHLLLRYDFGQLTIYLTLDTLYVCLALGLVARFLLLKRYFFDARELPMKLLWAGGMGLLAANQLSSSRGVPIEPALVFAVPFVLLLQNTIFEFAGRLLPECNLLALTRRVRSARAIAAMRESFD